MVGRLGVAERGDCGDGIDCNDDENTRVERCSVESLVIVQPMGHRRAQGKGGGTREKGKARGRKGDWFCSIWRQATGDRTTRLARNGIQKKRASLIYSLPVASLSWLPRA